MRRDPGDDLRLVTMCDLGYLPQMLVLHASMSRAAGREVELDVLALEPAVGRFLEDRGSAGIHVTHLSELEALDPGLREVREQRSWVEYCWTVTPAFCAWTLERSAAGSVVAWLDADIAFLRDPMELLDVLGSGSLLLVPHRYYRLYPSSAPVWLLTANWGMYNGGTIAFRNDGEGLAAVRRWRQLSLEWCFDRVEPGRFGNQKHLTDFPSRFQGTTVMSLPGGSLGPWNAGQFALEKGQGDEVLADGLAVQSYHYQSLRLFRSPWWLRLAPRPFSLMPLPAPARGLVARTKPWYRLGRAERRLFWRPYLQRLAAAVAEVEAHEHVQAELEPLRLSDLVFDFRHKARLTRDRVRRRLAEWRVWRRPDLGEVPGATNEPEPERSSP